MKTTVITLLFSLILVTQANAHLLEDLWYKYAPKALKEHNISQYAETPGRTIGQISGKGVSAFTYHWKYRGRTYELHYENPGDLAKSVYGLALYVGDVSKTLPKEKFFGGVLGYQYSVSQICAWLNDAFTNHKKLSPYECFLVGILLQDKVITISDTGWSKAGRINHVLAAAPGQKRTFQENLRHERLHVFWDEDISFREREIKTWKAMSEAERKAAREKLKNYSQTNEQQLIEEWAVKRAEASNMPLE